ncbi:actin nucleation-promoting factor WASL-like [Candoia aspera]|uniref:actin nucleation-promoting factor WASL-like n=1 Tax=Candoia aspera TaxID=51853 RepID=UPI002FD8560A
MKDTCHNTIAVPSSISESHGLLCNEGLLPSVVISEGSCMSPSKRTSQHNLIQSLKEEHLKRACGDYHLTPVSQEALICQIRKGTPLKPVAQNQPPKDEGIVAALKVVIQKRHKAIHASEFESDLENEEEWDE